MSGPKVKTIGVRPTTYAKFRVIAETYRLSNADTADVLADAWAAMSTDQQVAVIRGDEREEPNAASDAA